MKITPINSDKEINGVEALYYGVTLIIAKQGQKYASDLARLSKPYRRDFERGTIQDDVAKGILVQAIAANLLVGWKDFVVNGKEVECTEETKKKLLTEDDECRKFILEFSDDISNFLEEEKKEIVGKLRDVSSGK